LGNGVAASEEAEYETKGNQLGPYWNSLQWTQALRTPR